MLVWYYVLEMVLRPTDQPPEVSKAFGNAVRLKGDEVDPPATYFCVLF